jgi:pimeloyl-ACP methyl ester carboxylesterase
MRHAVTAVSVRVLLARMVKKMFAPRETPADFLPTLSREMLVRPVQLRANAEDGTFMVHQAKLSSERHQELQLPVAIFAGADDRIIDVEAHSMRLHDELRHSTLDVVPGVGHMVHYAAVDEIVASIGEYLLADKCVAQNVSTPRVGATWPASSAALAGEERPEAQAPRSL